MYYTFFRYGTENQFQVIHEHPPRQYADDLAVYENYVEVKSKPTSEQAETIFSLVKGGSLCGGISNAKTEKL
jgi:hypothetical protein